MCTYVVILASTVNVTKYKSWALRYKVKHLGGRGWDDIWRCAHLGRLLLGESTCAPSYLLPFRSWSAAATCPCCLVSSHIRSEKKKMVSSSEWKYTGWDGIALHGVCVCAHSPTTHRISNFKLVNTLRTEETHTAVLVLKNCQWGRIF